MLDSGVDEQGPYLALEYVAGATAARLIAAETRRGQAVPLAFAEAICRDAAEALAYAHALEHDDGVGVLHRDVSPDNLLVGTDGRCKLGDFGIARVEGSTQITTTGEMRGKLAYLAPELFEGAEHSFASDVFALGATVFRVMCGVPAFRGANDADIIRNVMYVTPPSLRDLRPDVSVAVADWVKRALTPDPKKRPTAQELMRCLSEPSAAERVAMGTWVASLAQPVVTVPELVAPKVIPAAEPNSPVTSRFERTLYKARWPLIAAGGLLLIAALTGIGVRSSHTTAARIVTARPLIAPAPVDPVFLTKAAVDSPAPAAAPAPAPTVATDDTPAPPTSKATRRARRGSLDIHVSPFADVFVDGDLVGTTPLKPIELAPGPHKVILANTGLNMRRTYRVVIDAEKRSRLEVDLRQDAHTQAAP